jgi:UDP-sulfoquinovose synthase
MRVLILGGDGYLGWPTAMHLSGCGHDVALADSYFRREACLKKDLPPLYPTPGLHERAALWKDRNGGTIDVHVGDVVNYQFLSELFKDFQPEVVIHYAEQPSAPYSMLGHGEALFTLQNNLSSTLNMVYAVHEHAPDCHIIKLGTMGEYGTPNIDIEEGWLDIEHKGRKGRFLFPRQAGSLYHTTKIQDTDLLWFYVRTWGLRVTDLMQGPVYGMFTEEMGEDERLTPHFNYDEVFGTVLNRFLVQAVAGVPLTVYGKGGQTRGYLNIKDTMQCLRLAVDNPANEGELRIFNQFTETFSVNDLAERVQAASDSIGLAVDIQNLPNPRVEAEEHYYNPAHHGLLELGLEPHLLTETVLCEILEFVHRHKSNIRHDIILPKTKWR